MFASSRPPREGTYPKNYSDAFDPKEYEWKTTEDLECYARNLKNYLTRLLQDDPFPAGLFEKLETRLLGIRSILEKRCQAKTGSNLAEFKKRKIIELDSITFSSEPKTTEQPPEPTSRALETSSPTHPLKKRHVGSRPASSGEPFYFNDGPETQEKD